MAGNRAGAARMDQARPAARGYATLADALDDLSRRGFTERFGAVGGGLRTGTGQALRTEDLVIREYHRFEGVSDPDDMAIVYAIEGQGGVWGTVTDAFGVYSDPGVGAALKDIPIRPAGPGGSS